MRRLWFCLLLLFALPVTGFAQTDAVDIRPELRIVFSEEARGGLDAFFLRPFARRLDKAGIDATLEEVADPLAVLRNGDADIGWFRASDIDSPAAAAVSLPFLTGVDPEETAPGAWIFAERHIGPDLDGLTLLAAHLRGPAVLHSRGRRVMTDADLQGMRISVGTQIAADYLTTIGARPRVQGESDGLRSLVRKETDAMFAPWDRLPALDLLRHARAHAEPLGERSLTNALYVMVIRDVSVLELGPVSDAVLNGAGVAKSVAAGRAMRLGDEVGRAAIVRIATTEVKLLPEVVDRLQGLAEGFIRDWITAEVALGRPARDWLRDAERLLQ